MTRCWSKKKSILINHSRPLFLCFNLFQQLTVNIFIIELLLMTGFELMTSGFGSNHYDDWATTTANLKYYFAIIKPATFQLRAVICNNENLPKKLTVITKFCLIPNKPSNKCQTLLTFGQNGEISPNLITLDLLVHLASHHATTITTTIKYVIVWASEILWIDSSTKFIKTWHVKKILNPTWWDDFSLQIGILLLNKKFRLP